jgi:hypothetical protein
MCTAEEIIETCARYFDAFQSLEFRRAGDWKIAVIAVHHPDV